MHYDEPTSEQGREARSLSTPADAFAATSDLGSSPTRPPLPPEDGARSQGLRDPGGPVGAALAWVGVIAITIAVFVMQAAGQPVEEGASPVPAPSWNMELASRLAVGFDAVLQNASSAGGAQPTRRDLERLLKEVRTAATSAPDRLRLAIVEGEVLGGEEALDILHDLETDIRGAPRPVVEPVMQPIALLQSSQDDSAPPAEELLPVPPRRDLDLLDREDAAQDEAVRTQLRRQFLLDDIAALRAIYSGDVNSADLDSAALATRASDLIDRHGWFGELALAFDQPEGSALRDAPISAAMRTAITLLAVFFVFALAFLLGLVLLIVAIAMRASGRLRSRYHPPAPGGSVYLQVFALFLLGFLLIGVLGDLIPAIQPFYIGLLWLLPLVALYPLLRRQPWAAHKHAIGWNRGRGLFREILAGVTGYIAGLPVFVFGILCTLALMLILETLRHALGMGGGPDDSEALSHPIVDQLRSADWLGIASLYLLAVVWAPFVEETVFRGALFHHLRARSGAILSGLVVGFLFAIIHPQGIAAVPALMSLAFVFAMLREWRGSLVAPITAHALHNATLVTTLILALG